MKIAREQIEKNGAKNPALLDAVNADQKSHHMDRSDWLILIAATKQELAELQRRAGDNSGG